MKPELSYCAREVYAHDRDRFYLNLFIPASCREMFFCFYALNLELARIPTMVSEEMIGHIRYAWWQEAVEGIYASGNVKGQPVLQALAGVRMPQDIAVKLISAYREHYPVAPAEDVAATIALELLQKICPQAGRSWHKAQTMIARHRSRHGNRLQGWLATKLLICNI